MWIGEKSVKKSFKPCVYLFWLPERLVSQQEKYSIAARTFSYQHQKKLIERLHFLCTQKGSSFHGLFLHQHDLFCLRQVYASTSKRFAFSWAKWILLAPALYLTSTGHSVEPRETSLHLSFIQTVFLSPWSSARKAPFCLLKPGVRFPLRGSSSKFS